MVGLKGYYSYAIPVPAEAVWLMKILVGYLMTKEVEAALTAAIAETKLRSGELIVLHARRNSDDDDAAKAHAQELQGLRTLLSNSGISHEVISIDEDESPADSLLKYARDSAVGLIVIGVRRRSAVGKLILGSNAQEVLLESACPVLAVKAK